ncbi:MAG: hypothetical protein GF353_09620 [Candidatus Lokiarchaeota archaeon]|nr:hypothetical protein [Candidatus Lokiarchaeota archaeon]
MSVDDKSINLFGMAEIKGKSLIILAITFVGIIAFTVLALIFFFLQATEVAMVFFGGAFLVSIFLWVFLSAKQVEKFLRSGETEVARKDKLILIGVSLSIFIFILAIFLTGETIAWWRVRVNQQSYDISGFIIPRALTTVATTFFSSILLLTWSTLRQVSNQAEELQKAEVKNENPLTIIERREKAISTTVNNIGKKGFIFIALIGVTIIFASDLNVYATQGILIIVPFAIAALITLIIVSIYQKKKKSPVQMVLDNLMKCPKCGVKTALGGNFCEKCGEKLVLGKRFSDGIECDECGEVNEENSKHCRYCNATLKTKK